MKSKLIQIRQALQNNQNIIIVGTQEKYFLPPKKNSIYWGHIIHFYVAPETDGIFTVKELQTCMVSLVPGVQPTYKDDFREFDTHIELGKLNFDEKIGTVTAYHEVVFAERDIPLPDGFVDGKRIFSESPQTLWRRIWIRLFPNIQIATSILESVLKGEEEKRPYISGIIPKADFSEYYKVVA